MINIPHYIIGILIILIILYKLKIFLKILLTIFLLIFLEIVYINYKSYEGETITNYKRFKQTLFLLIIQLIESISYTFIYWIEAQIFTKKILKLTKVFSIKRDLLNLSTTIIHSFYLGFPKIISQKIISILFCKNDYIYVSLKKYLNDIIISIGVITITKFNGFKYIEYNNIPVLNEKKLVNNNLNLVINEIEEEIVFYKSSFMDIKYENMSATIAFNNEFFSIINNCFIKNYKKFNIIFKKSYFVLKPLNNKVYLLIIKFEYLDDFELLKTFKFELINEN